jgi:limonene-1,2-epoxide hydrolase
MLLCPEEERTHTKTHATPTPHPFRDAVEAQDIEAAIALLAEDVVFRSPVVFKPYHGREAVAPLLRAVSRVFEDFRYEREIGAEGASDHALVFSARVGERELDGCDFLHTNEHGLIDDMCVMVRPLSGALALAEAMKAQLEAAQGGLEAARGD